MKNQNTTLTRQKIIDNNLTLHVSRWTKFTYFTYIFVTTLLQNIMDFDLQQNGIVSN